VNARLLDPRTEHLLRELAPQVLGATMRRFRDFAACEDAVQEALIAAALQWPRDGVPGNPRGWLIHVALRGMTDHVRSEIARRNRETAAAEDLPQYVHICWSVPASGRPRSLSIARPLHARRVSLSAITC
jgi:predicted RNA polymerase sigma factor